ncbi:hypothetical protein AX15_003845 [Amanita polypyramis BW_CC]|nr:hypothetical protein AX15_003845 [Amanita polypyramis BW_CC]
MDNGFAPDVTPSAPQELPYDNIIPYEHQVPPEGLPESPAHGPSLANRIGTTKVYLLSDTSSKAIRPGKRKASSTDENDEGDNGDDQGGGRAKDEMEIDQDPILRANAILLQGPPVSHLPTARIFDYAAHFDIHPLGLEWIDDTTCIFVFPSKQAARSAFITLQKPRATTWTPPPSESTLTMSTTELMTAHPIPISLWPPEDRIHHSLGVGRGLRGTLSMRWARMDDKKKRGANKDSAFYKKHGLDAGKESAGFGVVPASAAAAADDGECSLAKRLSKVGDTLEERTAMDDEREVETTGPEGVREWDRGKPGVRKLEKQILSSGSIGGKRKRGRKDDIDEFLGDDLEGEEMHMEENGKDQLDGDNDPPGSSSSKMRSDYIAKDGRTIIGPINGNSPGLVDRITARLPRRRSPWGGRRGEVSEEEDSQELRERVGGEGRGWQGGRRRGRNKGGFNDGVGEPPRKKTREELDEELEAFLNDRV